MTNGSSEWRLYLQSVYDNDPSIGTLPDSAIEDKLRKFSWFYHTELNPLNMTSVCIDEWNYNGVVGRDTAWVGWRTGVQAGWPESMAGVFGFFVNRMVPDLERERWLEVTHVPLHEAGVTWLYHTVGSGIFIDMNLLRSRGKILQIDTRFDWKFGHWSETPYDNMAQHNLSVIIIGRGLLSVGAPRTEVIVKWFNTSEAGAKATPCPLPNEVLSTGLSAQLPCRCNSTFDRLNCGSYLPGEPPHPLSPPPHPQPGPGPGPGPGPSRLLPGKSTAVTVLVLVSFAMGLAAVSLVYRSSSARGQASSDGSDGDRPLLAHHNFGIGGAEGYGGSAGHGLSRAPVSQGTAGGVERASGR